MATEAPSDTDFDISSKRAATEEIVDDNVVPSLAVKGHTHVYSTHQNNHGMPLLAGSLVDLTSIPGDSSYKMKRLSKVCNERGMKTPIYCLTIGKAPDLALMINAEKKPYTSVPVAGRESQPLMVALEASRICDLTHMTDKGNGRVHCHRELPVYAWFHAANLQLKDAGSELRVVPFPIENNDPELNEKVIYQMLPVLKSEYQLYQEVYHNAIQSAGSSVVLDQIFEDTAKISYEILRRRGVEKLTYENVDQYVLNIMLSKETYIEGVLIDNWDTEDFGDNQEDANKYGIFV